MKKTTPSMSAWEKRKALQSGLNHLQAIIAGHYESCDPVMTLWEFFNQVNTFYTPNEGIDFEVFRVWAANNRFDQYAIPFRRKAVRP